MQLIFSCSYLEEMVPPEILCSGFFSVELDTWDTLFVNRLVNYQAVALLDVVVFSEKNLYF